MSTYPSCKHDFSDPMGVCPLCEQENKIESLEQQLASAHRDATEEVAKAHKRGWEQAKREAYSLSQQHSLLSSTKSGEIEINELAIAIASMEYGGESKCHITLENG